MDLIMGQFAETHVDGMDEAELLEFERLLETPDWDVFAWITGDQPVPTEYAGPVLDRLIGFQYDPLG